MAQLDERFLKPLILYDPVRQTFGGEAFRKRNHQIPCRTRRMKTWRKGMRFYRSQFKWEAGIRPTR